MLMLRNRLKGARFAPFSFVLGLALLCPTQIGYQDIAALLAQQPGVAQRWQQYIFASSRRTMQVASFNFVRPIGTSVPETASYRLASLDSQGVDITGSIDRNPLGQSTKPLKAADFPQVVRTNKGDRLPVFVPPAIEQPAAAPDHNEASPTDNASVKGAKTAEQGTEAGPALDEELQAALRAPQLPQYDPAKPDEDGTLNDSALAALHAAPDGSVAPVETVPVDPFAVKTSSLFFGNASLGSSGGSLERWDPGEEPTIVTPPAADPDMKQLASLPSAPPEISSGGETIASKGEVTGENQRPKTPAERLKLDAESRAKSEKCLTEAIYYEARGEAVRGQMAVAQVVLNRAFSGFYPTTVCGVVYQNKHRHLACQFTFACDNVKEVVDEPEMWERAKKISKAMLDGLIWLPEVGKSTHYHAYWVRPSWVGEMKKMWKYGVHTFYRPRAWGDGHEAPSWGDAADTAAISAQLLAEAKSTAEQSESTPRR
ncbi:MAG: cell wall hydrolase [Bradyrhizobiaceae bacterium]|nr:MAG: cell wall hydrolase [Bradyrhizobiaceae bacterium]